MKANTCSTCCVVEELKITYTKSPVTNRCTVIPRGMHHTCRTNVNMYRKQFVYYSVLCIVFRCSTCVACQLSVMLMNKLTSKLWNLLLKIDFLKQPYAACVIEGQVHLRQFWYLCL